MRRLWVVLLVAMAGMTFGGVTAAAASAHEFESEVENTVLTGEKDQPFVWTTVTGAKIECSSSKLEGDVLGAVNSPSIQMRPSMSGCTFAGNAATVKVNDCALVFDGETDAEGHGKTHIVCPEGQSIEIQTSACTLDIKSQTPSGGVHYENIASSPGSVTLSTTVTGVTFTKTGSPILCAFTGSPMIWSGSFVVKGYELKSNSGTKETPVYSEGSQVGIAVGESPPPEEKLHSDASPAVISSTDEQEKIFDTPAGDVLCGKAAAGGTRNSKTTTSFILHPVYEECEFGSGGEFAAANVRTEGCSYLFGTETEAGHGPMTIQCESGQAVEIELPGLCTLKVGAQEASGGVDYENKGVGSSRDVTISATASGIAYEKVKPKEGGSLCYLVPGTELEYTAVTTMKAFQDSGGTPGAQMGIWVA